MSLENLCLFLSFLFALIALCMTCQKCTDEVTNKIRIKIAYFSLHRNILQSLLLGGLLHSINDFDQNESAKLLSLQLIHQKLEFKASGSFNIDSSLLISILASFLTYEIILVQFYFSGDK